MSRQVLKLHVLQCFRNLSNSVTCDVVVFVTGTYDSELLYMLDILENYNFLMHEGSKILMLRKQVCNS